MMIWVNCIILFSIYVFSLMMHTITFPIILCQLKIYSNLNYKNVKLNVAAETPSQLFPLLSPFVVPLASSASGLGSAKPPKPLPRNHSQANPTRSRHLILLSTASLPPYSSLETLLPSPPPPQTLTTQKTMSLAPASPNCLPPHLQQAAA